MTALPHTNCKQEKVIGTHDATLKHISMTLDRFITIAERIASQGEQLIDLRRDTDNLFSRMRELEMSPGKEGLTIKHNIIFAIATIIGSFIVALFSRHIK